MKGEVNDDMVKGENHDIEHVIQCEENTYTPESLYEDKRAYKPTVWLQVSSRGQCFSGTFRAAEKALAQNGFCMRFY